MKVKIKTTTEVEVDVKTLYVDVKPRYWEDTLVNGIEDEIGDLIPCKIDESWMPVIDVEEGVITNWKHGTIADIHYKVCDDGSYTLRDTKGKMIVSLDGYVPQTMCPEEFGCGDYIIMKVDESGTIANWNFNINDFIEEE